MQTAESTTNQNQCADAEIFPQRDLKTWNVRMAGAVDASILASARTIVDNVRHDGAPAARRIAESLGDLAPNSNLIIDRTSLDKARDALDAESRGVLERTAERIRAFADVQRASVRACTMPIDGGEVRQIVRPVDAAGCYAPGGRFPLPSSMLMTAVTARAAGVPTVIAASPRPTIETMAAASIADVDALLAIGGAQAIASLAYGIDGVPKCDVVVGPGNRWVTAAKSIVSADVRIDMLAGPSELVIVADSSASIERVAADLLAQAEHDPLALPFLIVLDEAIGARVQAEIDSQLRDLPTRHIARRALARGGWTRASSRDEAAEFCNTIAPEHLQLNVEDDESFADQLRHYGGLFLGAASCEVMGDYGAGPNHTLPTGGTARHTGGLSVFDFLKMQTVLRMDDVSAAESVIADSIALARMEGLEGHARAVEKRAAKGPEESS